MKSARSIIICLTGIMSFQLGCGKMQGTESANTSSTRAASINQEPADTTRPLSSFDGGPRPQLGATKAPYQHVGRCGTLRPNNGGLNDRLDLVNTNTHPSSHVWLLAKTMYAESSKDWSAENFIEYYDEKVGIGASAFNRLSLVNKWKYAVDYTGYQIQPKVFGFVHPTATYGSIDLRQILLYDPGSNFNVFQSFGSGSYGTGQLITDQSAHLSRVVNLEMKAGQQCNIIAYDSNGNQTPEGASINCECANLWLATELALDMTRTFINLDYTGDPFRTDGLSLAFNSNNRNPNGTSRHGNFTKFGRKKATDFWGIVKGRISETVPARPKPQKTFGKVGRAKPKDMKNAAGGKEFYSAESVVSIYGEELWVGAPLLPQHLWNAGENKFKTKAGDLEVLVNGVPVQLLYVGPTQINLLLPDAVNLPLGDMEVELRDDESYAFGTFPITTMSPGLYMAGAGFANGTYDVQAPKGEAAVNGSLITASLDGAEVPSSTATRTTIITLWGTGFRTATDKNVEVKLVTSNGAEHDAVVYYASAHATKGLCQLMILIPEGLPTGTYSIVLRERSTGTSSNGALIRVKK